MNEHDAMKRAVVALEKIAASLEKLAACTWQFSPDGQRVFIAEPRR